MFFFREDRMLLGPVELLLKKKGRMAAKKWISKRRWMCGEPCSSTSEGCGHVMRKEGSRKMCVPSKASTRFTSSEKQTPRGRTDRKNPHHLETKKTEEEEVGEE